MTIREIFGMAPKPALPRAAGAEIASSARDLIKNLRQVQNTAQNKGFKVNTMYQKSIFYAERLAVSAEKNKMGSSSENLPKLEKHAPNLCSSVQNVFNRVPISAALNKLSSISNTLDSCKLQLLKEVAPK
jgi:hypothetical protein